MTLRPKKILVKKKKQDKNIPFWILTDRETQFSIFHAAVWRKNLLGVNEGNMFSSSVLKRSVCFFLWEEVNRGLHRSLGFKNKDLASYIQIILTVCSHS